MITWTVQCHMPSCFLHCNSQTHKVSEPGWEAQASSPLGCSVWLLSYEMTVWSGPNSPSPAKALLPTHTHTRICIWFPSAQVKAGQDTTCLCRTDVAPSEVILTHTQWHMGVWMHVCNCTDARRWGLLCMSAWVLLGLLYGHIGVTINKLTYFSEISIFIYPTWNFKAPAHLLTVKQTSKQTPQTSPKLFFFFFKNVLLNI